jgi:hypothetical protein
MIFVGFFCFIGCDSSLEVGTPVSERNLQDFSILCKNKYELIIKIQNNSRFQSFLGQREYCPRAETSSGRERQPRQDSQSRDTNKQNLLNVY